MIIFIFLSQIYLQTIYSLSLGISVLSLDSIELFFSNSYLIFILGLFTIALVFKGKKYSDRVLLLFLCCVVVKNFFLLASSFNKMILVLNFLYLSFAFYFYMSWDVEISKACFNPRFSKNDLEKTTRFLIDGKLLDLQENVLDEVKISNIDEHSCFIILNNEKAINSIHRHKEFILYTNLEGVEFYSRARLTAVYGQGLGFELITSNQKNTQPEWSELYKVCLERGLFN